MNSLRFAGLLAMLVHAGSAQEPKPAEGVPAPTNIRGAEYPRIHDDLRVTFRIKSVAPAEQLAEVVARAQSRSAVFDTVASPVPVAVDFVKVA